MESSLTNTELSDSIVKIDSISDSDKSDSLDEEIELAFDSATDVSRSHVDDSKSEPTSREEELKHDEGLPESCSMFVHKETGATIYLVGTAHFSQESKDDVAKVIRMVQPNMVVLELCEARKGMLEFDEETILKESANLTVETIMATIKKYGPYYGLTYLLLLNLSAHITRQIGMAPGGEFRVAVKEAAKIPGCLLRLGDRSIKVTILRALRQLSWWQTIKLGCHLLFTKEPISKEDVEQCKRRDMLEQFLAEISGEYPGLIEVFVDERDVVLTYAIQDAARGDPKFKESDYPINVVAVVGAGHAPGISRIFHTDQSPYVLEMLTVPPPTITSKVVKATLKLTLVALGGYILYKTIPLPRIVRTTASHAFEIISDNIRPK